MPSISVGIQNLSPSLTIGDLNFGHLWSPSIIRWEHLIYWHSCKIPLSTNHATVLIWNWQSLKFSRKLVWVGRCGFQPLNHTIVQEVIMKIQRLTRRCYCNKHVGERDKIGGCQAHEYLRGSFHPQKFPVLQKTYSQWKDRQFPPIPN